MEQWNLTALWVGSKTLWLCIFDLVCMFALIFVSSLNLLWIIQHHFMLRSSCSALFLLCPLNLVRLEPGLFRSLEIHHLCLIGCNIINIELNHAFLFIWELIKQYADTVFTVTERILGRLHRGICCCTTKDIQDSGYQNACSMLSLTFSGSVCTFSLQRLKGLLEGCLVWMTKHTSLASLWPNSLHTTSPLLLYFQTFIFCLNLFTV